jgi:hypothetical protein
VLITATNVKLEAVSEVNGTATLADRFRSSLESQLLTTDARLKSSAQPETVISCTILRLESNQTAGSRQVQVTKQVGTKQEYNEKKHIYETKPNYQLVSETQAYTTVRGDMSVALKVREPKTGEVIGTETLAATFNKEYPANTAPPNRDQVEQMLMDEAIRQGVAALATTREPVKVLLAKPNDAIERLNKLAESGLWPRILEQLEAMPPLSDRKKEAYRLHNIGVAKEAIAYQTDDLATSRKLLDEASAHYWKAIEFKTDEKYFRDPATRIAESIAGYAELQRQQELIASAEVDRARQSDRRSAPPAARSNASAPARGNAPAASKSEAFTNQDVIDLVGSGIDETNLLATIKDAKDVSFDLSPAGLKQLLAGKVSNRVITAMRTKQGASAAPAPPKKPSGVQFN